MGSMGSGVSVRQCRSRLLTGEPAGTGDNQIEITGGTA